jgi:hypothetical protein
MFCAAQFETSVWQAYIPVPETFPPSCLVYMFPKFSSIFDGENWLSWFNLMAWFTFFSTINSFSSLSLHSYHLSGHLSPYSLYSISQYRKYIIHIKVRLSTHTASLHTSPVVHQEHMWNPSWNPVVADYCITPYFPGGPPGAACETLVETQCWLG